MAYDDVSSHQVPNSSANDVSLESLAIQVSALRISEGCYDGVDASICHHLVQ